MRRSSCRSRRLQLAQRITRAAGNKPLVIVLMNGRPLAIPWIADSVPAIIEGWYLGTTHGDAIANVLFGAYSPGGKLPVTIPASDRAGAGVSRAHEQWASDGSEGQVHDGIQRSLAGAAVSRSDIGLSYSQFRYDAPRVSRESIGARRFALGVDHRLERRRA